jgi:gas vesicle protein
VYNHNNECSTDLLLKEDDMKKLFAFFLGVVVGGVIGGGIALLLAPSSGQTLQQNVSDQLHRVVSEIQQAAIERRNELENELQQLRKADVRLE